MTFLQAVSAMVTVGILIPAGMLAARRRCGRYHQRMSVTNCGPSGCTSDGEGMRDI